MRALGFAAILLASAPAFAWDGPQSWYAAADADNPGGGGIIGTGGAHDHGIKCSHCHIDRKMTNVAFALEFSPPLQGASGQQSYAPGQRYTVTARMTNESLGVTCPDQFGMNTNNFAAAFEDDNGAAVGVLETDTGAISTACPQLPKMPADPGTTAIAVDCKVVFSKGNKDTTVWRFYWTAPASGAVTIAWGAVDGDCLMKSMDDAVLEGKIALAVPSVARSGPWSSAFAYGVARAAANVRSSPK